MLSRESRISLPDEAKQYIANMGESPIPSPKIDAFTTQPTLLVQSDPPPRTTPNGVNSIPPPGNPNSASLLSLDHREASNPVVPVPTEGPPLVTIVPSVSIKGRASEESEFLDLDDEDGGMDEDDEVQPPQPQSQPSARMRSKARAAVDDFPLPPSTAHTQQMHAPTEVPGQASAPPQTQPQGQVQAQGSVDAEEARAELTHTQQLVDAPSIKYPPIQSGTESPSTTYLSQDHPHSVPANFRALPLLSTDLPYTQIQVSHSSIRPNDRGKDVLSFIVLVDPGHGKDGWKVEKLYSDVLGLDQRIRASVGKGVGKKIASLPEGKLWRDHAPAKVDQRKVS